MRRQEVRVAPAARETLGDVLRARVGAAGRVGVAIDEHVAGLWSIDTGDVPVVDTLHLPRGERAKTRETLARLQDDFLELRRGDALVVVGGGATTDVGGFAAATLRRGIPWIAVPTTVIGMADAAVGGKVGINHPRGKNLLGAFHAADVVVVDPAFLETLDGRDIASGAAECWKVGRIADAALLSRLAAGLPKPGDAAAWTEVLQRAIDVKRALVDIDPFDQGARRHLNYGHTIGHALERVLGNDACRHGEAVAIGMQAAMALSVSRDLVPAESFAAQGRALRGLGLPTRVPEGTDGDALRAALALDKKRAPGARHTFVLPENDLGVRVHDDVTDDEVAAAIEAVL